MELAKITSKGQITLPISIRRALKLKDGDKVAFVEQNGQYVLTNPAMLAIQQLQDAFAGFAEENGLETEDDVVDLVKEIRAERKAKRNEDRTRYECSFISRSFRQQTTFRDARLDLPNASARFEFLCGG